MRLNYIGGSSTTGGTGTLTLAAVAGLALPAAAFIADSSVEYSIVEYSDSTLATVVRAESGFGLISSGNVLTRSAPRTTWNGTTYVQAAAAALSFGTSNVRVYVSPIAEGGPTAFPQRIDLSSGYGPNGYILGANMLAVFDYPDANLTANLQYMVPIKLEAGFPLTQIGADVVTSVASALLNCAVASAHPTTGLPNRILAVANGLAANTTGIKMGSITSRLFPPGWYWALLNSGHAITLRGCESFVPGPLGGLDGDNRTIRCATRSRTMANYTLGADALAGTSGSWGGRANNIPYPMLLMR